jgi:hypothetical protein
MREGRRRGLYLQWVHVLAYWESKHAVFSVSACWEKATKEYVVARLPQDEGLKI